MSSITITIKKLDNNNFIIKGYLNISEFNNKFNTNIEDDEYDTLNGYILDKLGMLPEVGTEIELENFHFIASNVDNRRIEDILVKIINKSVEGLI